MKLSEVVGGIPPEKGGYGANTIAQQDANQMQGEPMGKPDVNSLAANKAKNDQKKQNDLKTNVHNFNDHSQTLEQHS